LQLAKDQLIPVAPVFRELLGTPGLRKGSTTLIAGTRGAGRIALVLGLLGAATAEGLWCAAVDLPSLGLVAACELGVCLDRVVLVPSSGRKFTPVVATLLEGCTAVFAALPDNVASSDARGLTARAHERHCALVLVAPPAGEGVRTTGWPEAPDVTLTAVAGRVCGLEEGAGRITAHLLEVVATRRRAAPREVRARLWLPSPEGAIALAEEGSTPNGRTSREAAGAGG